MVVICVGLGVWQGAARAELDAGIERAPQGPDAGAPADGGRRSTRRRGDAVVGDGGAGDAGPRTRRRSDAGVGEGDESDEDQEAEEARIESDADEEAEEAAKELPEPQNLSPVTPVELPAVLQKAPEPIVNAVQNVADKMAESRAPPNRFLYGIFGLPRSRFGTGTAWLPDGSPLYASVTPLGRKWGLLINGNVYTGYNWYSSDRGGKRFMGRNTLVGALFRTFAQSEVVFRLAMSFEPLTIGTRGYPQILQTGQTADGKRIHDTMYALDFFRELGTLYSWEVTKNWAGTVYAALAGEPALGPVTFTQRISASADPLAPLGFQVQENSHASFGVLTVGAHTRTLKIEASWFNGEVPGKHRYTLALRKPDSYALRVSWNPGVNWSGQISYGYLERPVPSDPRHQHRVSSSITYTKWTAKDSGLAATLSVAERIDVNLNSGTALMLEAYWNIDGHNSLFGRAELLQKSARELVLQTTSNELFAVGSIAGGYIYYFGPFITLAPGIGARLSINPMENDLSKDYGTQVAYGAMVFAQLRTSALPVPSRTP